MLNSILAVEHDLMLCWHRAPRRKKLIYDIQMTGPVKIDSPTLAIALNGFSHTIWILELLKTNGNRLYPLKSSVRIWQTKIFVIKEVGHLQIQEKRMLGNMLKLCQFFKETVLGKGFQLFFHMPHEEFLAISLHNFSNVVAYENNLHFESFKCALDFLIIPRFN